MSSASKQQILAHIYRYLEENKLHEAAKALQAEIPSAVTAAKKVPKSALTVLAATSVADSSDDEPVRKPAPRKPSPKAAPKKAPIDSDSSDDEPVRKPAPRKPSPKSSPKAAPKKAPIDSDSSDDEPVRKPAPRKPSPKSSPKAAPKKAPIDSDSSDDEPVRKPAPRKPSPKSSPKAAPKKAPIDSDSSDDEPVRKPAPRKPSPKSSPKAAPKKAPIDSDSSDDEPVRKPALASLPPSLLPRPPQRRHPSTRTALTMSLLLHRRKLLVPPTLTTRTMSRFARLAARKPLITSTQHVAVIAVASVAAIAVDSVAVVVEIAVDSVVEIAVVSVVEIAVDSVAVVVEIAVDSVVEIAVVSVVEIAVDSVAVVVEIVEAAVLVALLSSVAPRLLLTWLKTTAFSLTATTMVPGMQNFGVIASRISFRFVDSDCIQMRFVLLIMSAYKRVANLRASRKKGFSTGIEANPCDISGVGWSSLESKFHELMELMDVPVNGISALEARAKHREKVAGVVVSLLDRAQEECRRLLVEGNAEAAEEAGVKVLHLRVMFYGENKLELVPAYLHLARTKQFLELYGDAEDMLSLAHFIVLHHQDKVSTEMKAELHQTFGLLYAADEKLDAAVSHLSCATYYLSGIHGPESILTSFSYFDLGNVFAAKASMENAMALYDTVKEIWYSYLMKVLQEIVEKKAEAEKLKKYEEEDEVHESGYASARAFGAENRTDTSKMLYGIYGIQRERFRVAHPSTARAAFVLGLFLLWIDNVPEASKFLREARDTSMKFYGEKHPVVQEIEEWSHLFDVSLNEECSSSEEEGEAEAVADQLEEHKQDGPFTQTGSTAEASAEHTAKEERATEQPAELKKNQPLSSQLKKNQPLSSQLKKNQPLNSQLKKNQPLSSQLKKNQPLSSQLKKNQPLSSQLKKNQPLSSQLKKNQPLNSQLKKNQPLNSQLKKNQPLSSQLSQLKANILSSRRANHSRSLAVLLKNILDFLIRMSRQDLFPCIDCAENTSEQEQIEESIKCDPIGVPLSKNLTSWFYLVITTNADFDLREKNTLRKWIFNCLRKGVVGYVSAFSFFQSSFFGSDNRKMIPGSPTLTGGSRSPSPSVRFRDPRKKDVPRPKAVLTTLTLLGVIYTASISGGYGLEDSIAAGGPLLTIIFLIGIPFVWGIPVSLCVAELSCAIPSNAGPIMWVNCSFPSWVTFAAVQWTAIFNIIDNSLYPSVFADYCATLFSLTPLVQNLVKVMFLFICTLINIYGVQFVGSFSVGIMLVTIMPFFIMFALQLPHGLDWARIAELPTHIEWSLFLPVVAWNFSGFDSAGNVIEEVQDPHSTFIRALLLMIGAALTTYIPPILAGASAESLRDVPFTDWGDGFWVMVGRAVGGTPMASVVMLGGGISTLGLMTTLLATTSRSLAGMGSINAFPNFMSEWISVYSESHGTPVRAILVNTCVTSVLAICLTFQSLVKIDQVLYAIRLILILSAFLKLRLTQPLLVRPYAAPGGTLMACLWAGVPIAFSLYLIVMVLTGGLGILLSSLAIIFGVMGVSYVTVKWFRPEGFEGALVEEYDDADTQMYGTILEMESPEWRKFHPSSHFIENPPPIDFSKFQDENQRLEALQRKHLQQDTRRHRKGTRVCVWVYASLSQAHCSELLKWCPSCCGGSFSFLLCVTIHSTCYFCCFVLFCFISKNPLTVKRRHEWADCCIFGLPILFHLGGCMTASFRRTPWGATEPLTEAEEYSLWSSHVRLLFAAPECYPSIYDRPETSGPPHDPKTRGSEPSPLGEPTSPEADPSATSCWGDEEEGGVFLWCFYSRMMRGVGVGPREGAAASPSFAETEDDFDRYSSVSEPLQGQEAATAKRLAARLRSRQKKHAVGATTPEEDPTTYLSCPFTGDAKVELQQAKLMEEMTALLLDVRHRNALYAQLQHQLAQTKLLSSKVLPE
eukprot:gene6143-4422_t